MTSPGIKAVGSERDRRGRLIKIDIKYLLRKTLFTQARPYFNLTVFVDASAVIFDFLIVDQHICANGYPISDWLVADNGRVGGKYDALSDVQIDISG